MTLLDDPQGAPDQTQVMAAGGDEDAACCLALQTLALAVGARGEVAEVALPGLLPVLNAAYLAGDLPERHDVCVRVRRDPRGDTPRRCTGSSHGALRTITDELGRTHALLTVLGVEQIIAFEKRCVNYRFTVQGRDLLTTVVTIPELAGQTFIELKTIADPGDVDAALDLVRSVLCELGVEGSDLTAQAYTDAVATQRGATQ